MSPKTIPMHASVAGAHAREASGRRFRRSQSSACPRDFITKVYVKRSFAQYKCRRAPKNCSRHVARAFSLCDRTRYWADGVTWRQHRLGRTIPSNSSAVTWPGGNSLFPQGGALCAGRWPQPCRSRPSASAVTSMSERCISSDRRLRFGSSCGNHVRVTWRSRHPSCRICPEPLNARVSMCFSHDCFDKFESTSGETGRAVSS